MTSGLTHDAECHSLPTAALTDAAWLALCREHYEHSGGNGDTVLPITQCPHPACRAVVRPGDATQTGGTYGKNI